jgi:hypothetical protein
VLGFFVLAWVSLVTILLAAPKVFVSKLHSCLPATGASTPACVGGKQCLLQGLRAALSTRGCSFQALAP